MIKNIKPWRFKTLEENAPLTNLAFTPNWIKGYLLMDTPEGRVKVEIDYRHISWWIKEFEITEDFIRKHTI